MLRFFRKKVKFNKLGPTTTSTLGMSNNFTPKEENDMNAIRLARIVEDMPLGVVIQRVQPKQAGNRWAAYYRTPGFGKYYGKTLLECLLKLTKDDRVRQKIEENFNKKLEKDLDKGVSGLLN